MTLDEFRRLARDYDLVPVSREMLFDTNTAVTAYAKIRDGVHSFLLESVIGGEKWARYTFLGSSPREVVRVINGNISTWRRSVGWHPTTAEDPFRYLQERLNAKRVAIVPGLPRFAGGAVGYIGYDMVRHIEHLPNPPHDNRSLADAVLLFTDTVIVIDNVFGKAVAICMCECEGDDDAVTAAYENAQQKLADIVARLEDPIALPVLPLAAINSHSHSYAHSFARDDFMRAVERIRDYIRAGDAFQVVLSQRMETPFDADPLDAYRVLRSLNPSPYLYLIEVDGVALVGSSPEVLVRVEERRVVLRPIAGTRKRGTNDDEDAELAADLLADQKERAEHLMLVDLARNDVGRVATFGSVEVRDFMAIERYSHVMHIVSQVEGSLRDGLDVLDVFRACFPAGTVSGAPKVRAMQIIDELEPTRRGPYAGAVGYFAYGGQSMDTAIAIRTIVVAGGTAYVQAGAGVVIDSESVKEWEETLQKGGALLRVIGAF